MDKLDSRARRVALFAITLGVFGRVYFFEFPV